MSNLYDDDLHDEQAPYLYDHDPETAEPYEDGYEDGYEEGTEGHRHSGPLHALPPQPVANPNVSSCIVIVVLIVLMSLIGC